MRAALLARPRVWAVCLSLATLVAGRSMPAQQMVTETRDPAQPQDEEFAKLVKEWTTQPYYISPLVDHLPKVQGIPTPKDVLGYYIGAPAKLTYYADVVKYYRALAAATPRVKVETIGKSDEDRELVVVWVSADDNIRNLQQNRDNLAKIADPRGLTADQIRQLIATTKPHYHLMGGLHSGETGPSEMLMELVYRLATETSPLIKQIRDNVIVSVTPVADPDGRDRNVDWFYRGLDTQQQTSADTGPPTGRGTEGRGTEGRGAEGRGTAAQAAAQAAAPAADAGGGRGGPGLPYWGKYVFHDNNRDINLSQVSMRAIVDWYFTAHPPIMHDLHEAQPLLYTYSGGPPQNPNLDPILFAELPFFSNFELAQMTKYGMPGVYTHGFMDGWSPGYLGSVAYNHNGMMRMYETQSGRESGPGAGEGRGEGRGADGREAGQGRGGRGGGGGGGGDAQAAPAVAAAGDGAAFGRGRGAPTGRGGGQPREWYRGLPIPPGAVNNFSRRNNTNYMQTGVLSGLQLTSMFPNLVIENFYRKTQNSIDAGKTDAPFGYVIPVQRDMTKAAELVRILRIQRIEVGQATGEIKTSDGTFPARSYVIKRDQPYGRLAKNLLEKQNYPDPNLTTYDDSGWTMGLAMGVDVKEIKDKAILDAAVTPIKEIALKGKSTGTGTAAYAVAHYGSNNMIALRYRFKNVPMKIADKSFTADGVEFPAGSFVIQSPADVASLRAAVEELGLTGAALSSPPSVPTHDADIPRVAMYSSWNGTQEIGWVRYTFDKFGIPYDLIYKERLKPGNLRADYDVIVMPTQQANRQAVFQAPAARPVPYLKDAKYKFLGMYGESPDISGGMGGEGVEAFAKFLDGGGTLITMGDAVRFPAEFGLARSVDTSGSTSANFYAPRPIVQAEVLRLDHPVFYGYTEKMMPIKYLGGPLMAVANVDQGAVLARYVGGDSAVLTGLMRGADEIRNRPFAIDVPGGYTGKGRVILFSNNPIYRWQNIGEFNLVFNALMNWNDMPKAGPAAAATTAQSGGNLR
ncbi:MAG TPA: M14 family zinc carboxypeptidase [Vicinamibacterales bacterium]|nr:M14 family zinc carboxypeptidase [Vicinamibacterales bacterium]